MRHWRAIDWHEKNVISGSSFYSTCIDCHRSLYHLTQLNYANWMAQWHGEVAAVVKWDARVSGGGRGWGAEPGVGVQACVAEEVPPRQRSVYYLWLILLRKGQFKCLWCHFRLSVTAECDKCGAITLMRCWHEPLHPCRHVHAVYLFGFM